MILYDSESKIKFYLDSLRIHITAKNDKGQIIWTKDPWKENDLGPYRTIRPLILDWGFKRIDANVARARLLNKGQLVIWITYHNTQFGFLTLNDGRFYFEGQD